MANSKKKSFIITLIFIVVIILVVILLQVFRNDESYAEKYEGYDLTSSIEGLGRENTYTNYLDHLGLVPSPDVEIEVDLFGYSDGKEVEVIDNYEGEGQVLVSKDDGYVEWNINVAKEGLYNIYIEYFPEESRGIDIERCIYINGEMPFLGADTIALSRVWTDKSAVKQDNRGNDIRPSQIEEPRWESAYFKDYMGYFTEPYQFYFKQGTNTLKLESVNEPLVIRKLVIKNADETLSYDEFKKTINIETYKNTDQNFVNVIQGEESLFRSSPSLYASFDRASSNTEPYSSAKIRLNMTGGYQWRVPGQWIEWEIEVPEDGLYNISIKGRQNYNRGFVSNRSLTIDGKTPFKEVSIIPFHYSNTWELKTLSADNGEPYQFPLTKGKHTIRLEVTLGDLGNILNTLEESVFRLNEMYRKILILTGTTPDKYRDYRVDKVYPEVIEAMDLESKILYKLVDDLAGYSGQRGSQIATAQTLAAQLERFVNRPDKIPKSLENFKLNISALGTSILTMSEAPLDVDSIVVSAVDAKLPEVKETFFTKVAHEFRSFAASFFEDYNSIGNVYAKEDAVTVWMLSGRDQSTILKTMIDDTFTPNTGISINVRLISPEVLLPAVVAGTGPDIALTVGQGEPVNFAIRGAVEDLSKFQDFSDVTQEYYEQSLVPYQFNGGTYALPETQYFNVLFYRKDILDELGLDVPDTWDDLIKILPTIQKNNMNVGIPSTERKINNIASPDLSNFFAQLYQRGGSLYNSDGSRAVIDTDLGVEAFESYTKFFTHYKVPTVYDFVNRFRTGEMPLGLADYNTFNTLSVFAPEIRGLWSFAVLPGTKEEDGTVNRSVNFWGNCSMMLSNAKNKENAWEFLKWWASSDTQVRFGRELESVMGASARYATANKVAFDQLAWSRSNSETLKEQWEWVVGTPEVPGGYYTHRHIINAVRKVINKNEDARETLLDYARTINDELEKKRLEFGLEDE
ncbi:MAG: hypothetical protein K0S41_1348 [Anaerocolumna sp.]|jgi:ABC-type glycerol-3-phosphate transport system substrate-binding protein|nr:hypothetical protein [Anaerocolumna sp.]